MDCREGFRSGTLVSLVAALAIAGLLVEAAVRGYEALFQGASLYAMTLLLALGVAAACSYSRVPGLESRVSAASPLVLGLAAAGVVAGAAGDPLVGGGLVVAAYFAEAAIGLPLARAFSRVDPLGARLFLAGISAFTLTLPLIVVEPRAAVLPLAADLVKTAGLVILLARRTAPC